MQSEVAALPASGFLRSRVIQIHPTLRCNLACAHCYSSSGPDARGELSPQRLVIMLERLRSEGYDVVSFSGGEPLMYRGLREVGEAARALGYRVNLITNGLGLHGKRIDELEKFVSLIGVSIDGPEPIHDRIRGPGTHRRSLARLKDLHSRGVRFGIAHCVTKESLPFLPDMLDLCQNAGAQLLQLHPLTLFGRASTDCGDQGLTSADLARAYLITEFLKVQAEGTLQVQLDLSPVEHVLANRRRYAVLESDDLGESTLSDLVNPIVIDERGRLMPLAYGMAQEQHIASGETEQWGFELNRYLTNRASPLRRLLELGLSSLGTDPDGFVDWYGFLVHCSDALQRQALGMAESEGQRRRLQVM
jgi:MoaA/NifB/PqqE/SkfB family radical SAM enzyme